jgi:probable rRNA maturation factor
MNRVQIDCRNIAEPAWLSRLGAFIQSLLRDMGRNGWEVSVVLCDDSAISAMNHQYRNKEGPTDVLSFPQIADIADIPRAGPFLAGDIVISLDSLRANSDYFKVDLDEEFKRLVIHGILHLSGLDHDTNDADEPMLIEQERLLAQYRGETVFTL